MRRCCLLLVCLLLLTGCGRADTQDVSSFAPAEGDRLVIFTSHKETIYEPILKEFEQRTGIWVELETGGTVTLLERIAAGESGADLMFGGGADSLSAYSACFAPYVSEYAGDVAPEYDLGGGIWTPFSALPVVLIYNTKLVRQNPPERWADLLDAGWRGRIAFADPTVSGSSCPARPSPMGSTSPSSTPPRARASCRTARPSSAAARTRKTRGNSSTFCSRPMFSSCWAPSSAAAACARIPPPTRCPS